MEVKSGLRQPRQQTFPCRYFLSRTSQSTRSAVVQHIYSTTWWLLKQAQRNLREGVGRLGLRVRFNQVIPNIPKVPTNFQQSLRPLNCHQIQTATPQSQAWSPDNLPRPYQRKLGKASALHQPKKRPYQSMPQKQTTSRLSNRSTSVRLLRSSLMISTS